VDNNPLILGACSTSKRKEIDTGRAALVGDSCRVTCGGMVRATTSEEAIVGRTCDRSWVTWQAVRGGDPKGGVYIGSLPGAALSNHSVDWVDNS